MIKEINKGKNNPNWKGGKPKCLACSKIVSSYHVKLCRACYLSASKGPLPKCIDCGKELTGYKYTRCWNCYTVFKVGSNNPRYIDGRYPLVLSIRKLFNYKIWRKEVFERDNYTCQECFKRGGDLEVHHCIKSFSDIFESFIIEYDQFSPIEDKETLIRLAIKYKSFWDTNNGKTLCIDCHKVIDKCRK